MRRDVHGHRSFQRVDAHLVAEDGLIEGHVEVAADGVAFDTEAGMADELDRDQRVAGFAAERVGAALPVETDDLAGPRPRRDGDLNGAAGRKVDARLVAACKLLERHGGGGGDVLAARLLRPASAGPGAPPEASEDVA